MAKTTKIKDVFNGRALSVWEDDETVTLALGFTTIAIPKENWKDVKKDLKELVRIIK